jgi:hypothetical protein
MQKTCTIDEVGCDKIEQYRQNMMTKAALKQPKTLESEVTDYQHEDELEAIILDHSIRHALPENLIDYYEKLIAGEKVPPRIKKQIREIVTGVINNA